MDSSEIVRNTDGSIYHLRLFPEEVADHIILVGDPARVPLVSKHFEKLEIKKENREFITHTGWHDEVRISVISTGIGTDNIDIVLNELYALKCLEWKEMALIKHYPAIKLLRLGTCGGLQADLPIGKLIATRFAIGTGGLLHYYIRPLDPLIETLEAELERYVGKIHGFPTRPYGTSSSVSFYQTVQKNFPDIKLGITLTASGFYGPQGRWIGNVRPKMEQLVEKMAAFSFRDFRLMNLEMETAGIFGLAKVMGFEAGSLSTVLVNRRTQKSADVPQKMIEDLILSGLQVFKKWNSLS